MDEDDVYKFEDENIKVNTNSEVVNPDNLSTKEAIDEMGEIFNMIKFSFQSEDPENLLINLEKLNVIQENSPKLLNLIPKHIDFESVAILPVIFNTLYESIDSSNEELYNQIITKIIILFNNIIAQDSINISELIPSNPNPDENVEYHFLENVKQLLTTISNTNVFPSLLCTLKNLMVDDNTHDKAKAKFPLSFLENITKTIMQCNDDSIRADSVDNILLVFEGMLEFPMSSDEGYIITDLVFELHELIEDSPFAISHTCSIINRLIDQNIFDYSKANANELIGFIYSLLFNDNHEVIESASATVQRIFSFNQFPKSIRIDWDHILQLMTPDCSDHLFLSLANLLKEYLMIDGSNYEFLPYFREKYKIGTHQQKVYCINVICSIIMTPDQLIEKCFSKKIVHLLLYSLSLYHTNKDLLTCVPQSLGILYQYAITSGRLEEWELYIGKCSDEIRDFMEYLEEEIDSNQTESEFDDNYIFELMKEIFYNQNDSANSLVM